MLKRLVRRGVRFPVVVFQVLLVLGIFTYLASSMVPNYKAEYEESLAKPEFSISVHLRDYQDNAGDLKVCLLSNKEIKASPDALITLIEINSILRVDPKTKVVTKKLCDEGDDYFYIDIHR